jgi:hypothetical protein
MREYIIKGMFVLWRERKNRILIRRSEKEETQTNRKEGKKGEEEWRKEKW